MKPFDAQPLAFDEHDDDDARYEGERYAGPTVYVRELRRRSARDVLAGPAHQFAHALEAQMLADSIEEACALTRAELAQAERDLEAA